MFLLAAFPSISASAQKIEIPDTSGASAVYFYNITYDNVIVSENIHSSLNSSTSAKVTMGLIACEKLAERTGETITVTEEMLSNVSGTKMNLKVGEEIKILDLLYGAICGSYNDAAYVIAHTVSGSTEDFVSLMNSRVKELGTSGTLYTNPIGYPDNDAMVTTASDVSKIALAASKNALYMTVSSAYKHEMGRTNMSDARTFYNRNYLICSASTSEYYTPECRGMNAGYTGERGGWSVVTLAQDEGVEYLCVILGGKESEDGSEVYAYSIASALINEACKKYNLEELRGEGHEVGMTSIELTGIATNDAAYITAAPLYAYIPKGTDESELQYEVIFDNEKIVAPIEAGTKIGVLKVLYDGDTVGKCDLILRDGYEKNPLAEGIQAISDYTSGRAFTVTLISFAVALPISLYVARRKSRKYDGRIKR